MRRKIFLCLSLMSLVISGCFDQTTIEDISAALVLGMDLDDQGDLLVYMSSPVFNKEAETKEEVYQVKAVSLRNSRNSFDERVMGLSSGSKTQIFLIGKRLLKMKNWDKYLDPFYRDPKNTVTSRVVAVDGAVKDIIFDKPVDKSRLPLYLTKLIDTAAQRNLIRRTTLQEFRGQMVDKGRTPWIIELAKGKMIELKGSTLLTKQGQYQLSITQYETELLRILEGKREGDYSLTLPVSSKAAHDKKTYASFSIPVLKVKKRVRYKGRFVFNIDVKLKFGLGEQVIPLGVEINSKELEKNIQNQLEKDLNQLIHKLQKNKVDPLGLGLYARAYTYPEWKKNQDHWVDSLAASKINIHVDAKIKSMGTMR
ncbi:Ger(x)C family spore germination protein [Fictibacillus sp. Mic-4]|uniref:Ger(x)C family spore germination protein n=1 Tax=Fictibacillus sp. Mic-4 TaxID=3132826 RepID=UPI003CEEEDD1